MRFFTTGCLDSCNGVQFIRSSFDDRCTACNIFQIHFPLDSAYACSLALEVSVALLRSWVTVCPRLTDSSPLTLDDHLRGISLFRDVWKTQFQHRVHCATIITSRHPRWGWEVSLTLSLSNTVFPASPFSSCLSVCSTGVSLAAHSVECHKSQLPFTCVAEKISSCQSRVH